MGGTLVTTKEWNAAAKKVRTALKGLKGKVKPENRWPSVYVDVDPSELKDTMKGLKSALRGQGVKGVHLKTKDQIQVIFKD